MIQEVTTQLSNAWHLLGWGLGFYFGPIILVLIALIPTSAQVAYAFLGERAGWLRFLLGWIAKLSRALLVVAMLVVGKVFSVDVLASSTAWQELFAHVADYLSQDWLSAALQIIFVAIFISLVNVVLERVMSEYRTAWLLKQAQRQATPSHVRLAILAVFKNMVTVPVFIACVLHALSVL